MNNLGPGVSRVLNPDGTEFVEVIWQQGRPPLDAEFNLMQELASGLNRRLVLRGTPSGWLGNETNLTDDFVTNANWSNWFQFGRQKTGEQKAVMWAVVNGWMVPVTGTRTGTPPGTPDDTNTWNKITLDPPPLNSGDTRIDFVFLEVWLARVPPNPSTLNKPSASAIYRYGNVEGGSSFLPDDLQDPSIGEETTQRVQVQHRIRVVKGPVGLATYPDGFDPLVVLGQGGVTAPTTYPFANMRKVLGDTGLWRAGDGSGTAQTALGTVDGYTYAIPMCVVFRRNGVAWLGDPSPNLNGAFNRNIRAIDRTGVQTYTTTPTLGGDLGGDPLNLTVTLASGTGIPLPLAPATAVVIQIGDELMTYSAISGTTMTLVTRGLYGTRVEAHVAGEVVRILSGRPDGLFADQIAKTDILDLRHAVNPNGFNYDTLLRSNLDKLLKGRLRANWKRTGAGPQGPFCIYQDKIVSSATPPQLGVTRLDGPDNIRTVFSDAAVPQKIDLILNHLAGTGPVNVGASWTLGLTVTSANKAVTDEWTAGDTLTVGIAQFKSGLAGGDADQVRFLNDNLAGVVTIRVDGQPDPMPASAYMVTPSIPSATDPPTMDLTITLTSALFTGLKAHLYLTVCVQYGPGRGLGRRPDAFHQAAFLNPSVNMLVRPTRLPEQYLPMHTGWLPLWSRFRNTTYRSALPVTSEAYVDPGSKSVALTPFRYFEWPLYIKTMDGTSTNPYPFFKSGANMRSGGTPTVVRDTVTDFTVGGIVAGDLLSILPPAEQAGRYQVVSVIDANHLMVDRMVPSSASVFDWEISHCQGLMPMLKADGVTPKWTETDPLSLFSGQDDGDATRKNIYTMLPRTQVPGWGEVHVPILTEDGATFFEGINFGLYSPKGAVAGLAKSTTNYVAYDSGVDTFSILSTWNNVAILPATYNTAWTGGGHSIAGCRQFTDTRGLNRKGLELPPFYGIARLFAVYEAQDYYVNESGYAPLTREVVAGNATNLLRQDVSGPTFWIEIDDDGDSTFVLNADCLDLSRSPNPIASFETGEYVIEASLFGFDRGSFDLTQDFRLVLSRSRTEANTGGRPGNININITGPAGVLPAPLTATDSVVLTYSRTPYQGDAWGSQTNYTDISQHVGPMTTGVAYEVASMTLDENHLTRPNQKVLEVLATQHFLTTLGTGRISGDLPAQSPAYVDYDVRNVGFEDGAFPPTSGVDPRPRIILGALENDNVNDIGTELHGCTERLPLGSLFRDKDFRGGSLLDQQKDAFVFTNARGQGSLVSLARTSQMEQTEALTGSASLAAGAPGDLIVHVDGEQGNFFLLTNYRTYRGGSAFAASGPYPGGEVVSSADVFVPANSWSSLLSGTAMLVRNTDTTVGATEVSAGDELMLMIITTGARVTGQETSLVGIGTNGSFEGNSAADLYRIEGHPLVNDNVRTDVDPSQITLTKAT